MSKVSVQVEVEEGSKKVFDALVGIVKVLKLQLADGFQPVSDLPAMVIELIRDLPPVLVHIQELPADIREDKAVFARTAALFASDLMEVLLAPGAPKVAVESQPAPQVGILAVEAPAEEPKLPGVIA